MSLYRLCQRSPDLCSRTILYIRASIVAEEPLQTRQLIKLVCHRFFQYWSQENERSSLDINTRFNHPRTNSYTKQLLSKKQSHNINKEPNYPAKENLTKERSKKGKKQQALYLYTDIISNFSKEKHLKSRLQPQPKDGDLVINNDGIIIKYGRFYSSLVAVNQQKEGLKTQKQKQVRKEVRW